MNGWTVLLLIAPGLGISGLYFHRLAHGRATGVTPLAAGILSWGASLLLYLWNPLHYFAISDKAWGLLAVAAGSFAVGYGTTILGSHLRLAPAAARPPAGQWDSVQLRPLRRLWVLAGMLTLALFSEYFVYIFRTYGFSSIHVILFQLRTQQAAHGAPTFGFYFFYAAELLVPLSVVLALGDAKRRRRYVLVALVSIGALLTTSGRTNATIAIVWSLCVLAIFWGGRQFKFSRMAALALGVVSLLGLFLLLGTAIGKTYANSAVANEFGENPPVPALLVEPYFYVSSPLADFSQVVAQSTTNEGGKNTFREVFQVIHAVEPQVTVPPLVEAFHYIPYPDNVSTSITPFYEDFGVIGVLIGEFLVGVLLAWAYSTWSTRRSPASLALAAMATLVAFTSTGPAQYNQPSWIIQALLLCFTIHAERQARRRAGIGEARAPVASIAD